MTVDMSPQADADTGGIQWARIECEFALLDDERLAALATPLGGGAWCIEACTDDVVALTLNIEPVPEDMDGKDMDAEQALGGAVYDSGDGSMAGAVDEGGASAIDPPGDRGEPESGCVLRFSGQRFANVVAASSVRLGTGVAGLVYRASKKGDYLCMEMDPAAGSVSLVKVKDGMREVLATEEVVLPSGEWLYVYLRHVNPFHSLSINGALALTTEYRVPGGYLATGAVGLKGEQARGAHFARLGAVDVVAGD
ncbi:MAG: hypothetical protein U5S82_22710 [Gammaproteobacteria bacterium]|nr:hypothetical protein [Gammaproteobacteria bacterium]